MVPYAPYDFAFRIVVRLKRKPMSVSRVLLPLASLLPLILSGCIAVGPDYTPPHMAVPAQWHTAATTVKNNDISQWWKQFNDPTLDKLIEQALQANTDLLTARAQLRHARALRRLAGGDRYPSVNISGSRQYNKIDSTPGTQLYNAEFDASWELDLFGAKSRALEAATADMQASREALHDARVAVVAEVARNYIDLRTAERRLDIAEKSLQALTDTYQLTRWRRKAGLVSELDVLQARTLLEQTRATLPPLRTSVKQARHRLAVLLGRNPGELQLETDTDHHIPTVSTAIAVAIPARVLEQRPDVRRAERQLAAQTARLGEAEAARYPSLQLSGSIGLQALRLSGLDSGDSRRSLLTSITAPIFDAGRIRSNIEAQDALLEQARLAYTAAVRSALEDVENALVTLHNTDAQERQLRAATVSAEAALAIAKQQYSAGLADFQSVLDSQRTVLNLEDQLASGSGALSSAQIQLYKALGGGWSTGDDKEPG